MPKINVSVFIEKEDKNNNIELEKDSLVSHLLKKLEINPVTVLVTREDELILEDERLNDKDEIKLLSVISGG